MHDIFYFEFLELGLKYVLKMKVLCLRNGCLRTCSRQYRITKGFQGRNHYLGQVT